MNEKQVWEHLDRKYKDSPEKATFLYEVFYNRKKLVSYETYNSVHGVLTTPICTGVVFGQLAKQMKIQRPSKPTPEEIERRDLERVKEFLDNLEGDFGKGSLDGVTFCASYVPKKMLMVSMLQDGSLLERLVASFSKAIEYKPFCRYTDLGGMKTYEWAKKDSKKRYTQLRKDGKDDLVKLKHDAMKQLKKNKKGGKS